MDSFLQHSSFDSSSPNLDLKHPFDDTSDPFTELSKPLKLKSFHLPIPKRGYSNSSPSQHDSERLEGEYHGLRFPLPPNSIPSFAKSRIRSRSVSPSPNKGLKPLKLIPKPQEVELNSEQAKVEKKLLDLSCKIDLLMNEVKERESQQLLGNFQSARDQYAKTKSKLEMPGGGVSRKLSFSSLRRIVSIDRSSVAATNNSVQDVTATLEKLEAKANSIAPKLFPSRKMNEVSVPTVPKGKGVFGKLFSKKVNQTREEIDSSLVYGNCDTPDSKSLFLPVPPSTRPLSLSLKIEKRNSKESISNFKLQPTASPVDLHREEKMVLPTSPITTSNEQKTRKSSIRSSVLKVFSLGKPKATLSIAEPKLNTNVPTVAGLSPIPIKNKPRRSHSNQVLPLPQPTPIRRTSLSNPAPVPPIQKSISNRNSVNKLAALRKAVSERELREGKEIIPSNYLDSNSSRESFRESNDLLNPSERSFSDSPPSSPNHFDLKSTSKIQKMIQIDDCDSATPTEESKAESIESLRSHLPFLNIVSRGKELFGAEIVLTVLQAEEQLYLSTGGDVLSEATTFISHSILTQARGLIVLDALNDSRFSNFNKNDLGFFVGLPLFCPNSSKILGTLCIVGNSPRKAFTKTERDQLRRLAISAAQDVSKYNSEKMEEGYLSWRAVAEESATFIANSSSTTSLPQLARTNSADTFKKSQRFRSESTGDNTFGFTRSKSFSPHSSHAPSVKHNMNRALAKAQKVKSLERVFDSAVESLASTLNLSLVYLVALDIRSPSVTPLFSSQSSESVDVVIGLRLLASCGLKTNSISFDEQLHLKSLRAPEGGIIYQNPTSTTSSEYSSGILISIAEKTTKRLNGTTGYVLAGFSDEKREFKQEDLEYFCRFSEELESWAGKENKMSR